MRITHICLVEGYTEGLNYQENIHSSPKIDDLVNSGVNNQSSKYLIQNTIISLNKSVKENRIILSEKSSKEKYGLLLMKSGLIVTAMFIIYLLVIIM